MSAVRGWITPRRLAVIGGLTAAWCMLWGSFSVANVLSGLVVGSVGSLFGDPRPGGRTVRVGPLLTLSWLVAIDLMKATVAVVREILTPTDYTDEVIIAVDVPSDARSHLLLLVVAITVTPGTAVVDTGTGAEPGTGRLYLHLLHAEAADDVVEHVQQLAATACAALPVDDPVVHPADHGPPIPSTSTPGDVS